MTHTPNTCDDCSVTWDRKNNPKDIVLCPLHRAAPALLEALAWIKVNSHTIRHARVVAAEAIEAAQ